MSILTPEYAAGLVRELVKLPHETPWLEFKKDNANPREIGEYLSALANSAALHGKAHAYILWGIDDVTHEIAGTTFAPETAKKGNEPLESWLLRLLKPRIHFCCRGIEIDGKAVVLLESGSAYSSTTGPPCPACSRRLWMLASLALRMLPWARASGSTCLIGR